MIELEPGDGAITPAAAGSVVIAPTQSVSVPTVVELTGEIVDSKCFLGAMKPGEGKPHKACATLCIIGGIPPVFVTRDRHGREETYLLQGPDARVIDPAIHPLIADTVRVRGRVVLEHGLKRLTLTATDVTRVSSHTDSTLAKAAQSP